MLHRPLNATRMNTNYIHYIYRQLCWEWHTVKPLCRRHHWDLAAVLYREISGPNSEADLYTRSSGGCDSRQCPSKMSILYWDVPLYPAIQESNMLRPDSQPLTRFETGQPISKPVNRLQNGSRGLRSGAVTSCTDHPNTNTTVNTMLDRCSSGQAVAHGRQVWGGQTSQIAFINGRRPICYIYRSPICYIGLLFAM